MIYGIVPKTRTRRPQRCEKTPPSGLSTALDCTPCHPLCIVNIVLAMQIRTLTIHVALLVRPVIQNQNPSPFWCWQDDPIQHAQFVRGNGWALCVVLRGARQPVGRLEDRLDAGTELQLVIIEKNNAGPEQREQHAGHYLYRVSKFYHVIRHREKLQNDIKKWGCLIWSRRHDRPWDGRVRVPRFLYLFLFLQYPSSFSVTRHHKDVTSEHLWRGLRRLYGVLLCFFPFSFQSHLPPTLSTQESGRYYRFASWGFVYEISQ